MIKTVTANRIKNIEGFEYLPQFNFSDDGNRFTMWMYKGIPFSQHRDSKYGTFISLRYDYLPTLKEEGLTDLTMDAPWEMWHKTEAYSLGSKFNDGLEGFELEDLMSTIEKYREGIIEVNKQFAETFVNVEPLKAAITKEVAEVKKILEESKANFDWLNASDYAVESFRSNYKTVEKKIATAYDSLNSKVKVYELAQQYARKGWVVFDIQPLEEGKKPYEQSGDYYLKKVMYAVKHSTEKHF
jgi:hypothetical protein